MPSSEPSPLRRLLGHRRFVPAALGVAVLAVLLQGLLQGQPSPQPPEQPAATPTPAPRGPLLRPDLEKTPLSYFSDYWKQLAERVRPQLVPLGRGSGPALVVASGLMVAPLRAVEALEETQARRALLGDAPRADPPAPRLVGVEPTLDFALLAAAGETPPAFVAREARLNPGQLVAAVGVDAEGQTTIVPGHVTAAASGSAGSGLRLSLRLPAGFGAAAVVDLDGRLVGAAFEGETGPRLYAAAALMDAVARLQRDPLCRALRVESLPEQVRGLLGIERGVLVESVVAAAFVPEPSLATGDVLLDWGGEPMADPATFQQAYRASPPGKLVRYRILRDGAVLRGATRMPASDCRPLVEQPVALQRTGLALRQLHGAGGLGGVRVLAVRADAPAAAAGLQEGDVIVSAGPAAGSASAALRMLESYEKRPRPLLLRVERDGVLRLAALGAGS